MKPLYDDVRLTGIKIDGVLYVDAQHVLVLKMAPSHVILIASPACDWLLADEKVSTP